ncbi:MAG: 23S rRNA (pseudouridine(1915)-N(3))-methyltransferase RlmH [Bacteroidota bacterium]
MTLKFLFVGKTANSNLVDLMSDYERRLKHYIKFETVILPELKHTKNSTPEQQQKREGEQLLKVIGTSGELILLDEKGKEYTSRAFAIFLQKKMNNGPKQLWFVVGGPYGFSEAVRQRANGLVSLSKMTFSHQMVRLFALEQCYRAFTILRNEPYHHD